MSEQSFNIASAGQVQHLLWTPLLGKTMTWLTSQPLGKGTLDIELTIAGFMSHLLRALRHLRIHRVLMRGRLHLLGLAHRCHRGLVLMLMRVGLRLTKTLKHISLLLLLLLLMVLLLLLLVVLVLLLLVLLVLLMLSVILRRGLRHTTRGTWVA